MIKNKLLMEVKIGERLFELFLSHDSPLGEVFDAVTQMQRFVLEKMKENVPPEEKKEESKDV